MRVRQPSRPPGSSSTPANTSSTSRPASRVNCSRTTAALSSRCAAAVACCQSQPPQRPGPACGHGGGTRSGDARRTSIGIGPAERAAAVLDHAGPHPLAGQGVPDEDHAPGRVVEVAGHAGPAGGRRPDVELEHGAEQRPGSMARSVSHCRSACRRPPARSARVPRCGPAAGAAGPSGRIGRLAAPALESSCHGTLVTITPGSNSSRPFSRSADWLCSSCSHQCPTTYSGMNTLTTSRGRSLRSCADVVEQRPGDLAVGRLEHGQLHRQVVALPLGQQVAGVLVVDVDGQRGEGVGPGRLGEGQRAQRRLVHLRHQHDDVVARGQHQPGVLGGQLARDPGVVLVDRPHARVQDRHRDEHQVGALVELGDHDDDQHDAGQRRAERVDRARAADPAALLRVALGAHRAVPVPHHAGLARA